jgi:hypothetical protein
MDTDSIQPPKNRATRKVVRGCLRNRFTLRLETMQNFASGEAKFRHQLYPSYTGDSHRASRFSILLRTISPAWRKGRLGFLDSAQCFKPLLKITAIDQIKDFEFFGLQFEQ